MKAVTGIRWLLMVLCALALAACGNGSVKSPDAESVLTSLTISPSTATLALGRTQQFTASGTCQIADQEPTPCSPSGLDWETSDSNVATIDDNGLLTSVGQGTVTVTASKDGVTSNTATVTVGAPVLESLVVYTIVDGESTGESSATVALGSTQAYKVFGVYSNSSDPQEINALLTPITWTSSDTSVATVAPTNTVQTNATPVGVGTATLTASTTNSEGTDLTGDGTITVTNAALVAVSRIDPTSASISVGASQTFTVYATYADGSESAVDPSDIDWTSSDATIATVDATGSATGVAEGTVTITATLKDSVSSSGSTRSISATLVISPAACTSAMLASQGAETSVEKNSDLLCLGCIIADQANVIDDDSTNYASAYIPVGLLGGDISLTVTAADGMQYDASTDAPATTGFIIARPANQLLSAELLDTITVSTLMDGSVVESGTADSNLLRLTLLGQLGDNELALVTINATQPYDAIKLTLSSGLLSALTTTQIYSACATAAPPTTE
ncbi:Ig-like domain-containing protein [Solimonas marina]|uniref:BIG2 domain-containing protein n=1 Tax=Solimonas marina TaxID=2714601 RepID=A0A969WB77_9GAMM|nr:Ig-like domain-containing protein [Solimonas marina]NKF23972.1 hypothetical protein [Solimonas marina]